MRSKRLLQKSLLSALAAVSLAAAATGPASAAELPTVTTGAPTEVTPYSAVFHATVETHGEPTSVAFQYGSTTEYGDSTKYITIGNGNYERIPVSTTVRDLTGSANFHVRAVAGVSSGGSVKNLAFGKDEAFTTTGGLYVTMPVAGEKSSFAKSGTSQFSGTSPVVYAATPSTIGLSGSEGPFTLVKGPVEGTCESLLGSLTAPGGLPETELELSNTILGPAWGDCELAGGIPASVDMNSCHFVFNTLEGWAEPVGEVAIACATPEDKIVIAGVGGNASLCSVEMPAQHFGPSVIYSNDAFKGTSIVRAYAEVTGMDVTVKGILCGTGTVHNAKMEGELIFA